MTKEIKITSLKLTNSLIRTVKYTEIVEAELRLTFKAFNIEDYQPKDIFLQATKKGVQELCWENERDFLNHKYNKAVSRYIDNNPWLTYKPKFDTFIYHKFFTWNLVTQATIQQIKLREAGINSHYMYGEAIALLACLQTLNAWDT
jgi:hypothetical protein